MDYSISTLTVLIIALDMMVAFLVPFVLYFIIRAKKSVQAKPFLFGFLVMFIFNIVLKNLVSVGIISLAGDLMNNIWFYGIMGGIMAGLFEEIGRFLAMKFTLSKYYDNDYNAIGYGLGHGGFELIFLLGISMIGNITIAFLVSSGNADALFVSLSSAQDIETMDSTIKLLCETSPFLFLISPIERAAAYIAQIGLSVVVWFGVKNKNYISLLIVIIIHAVMDAVSVIVFDMSGSYVITEILIWIMAISIAIYAKNIWRQNTLN